mmetsp:Transcript_7000/g.10785  ORF Transcript_7000/g.10785 Transcript_7000/m.10785 type:complete len:108 (+) Transcript_7000:44-367(+)
MGNKLSHRSSESKANLRSKGALRSSDSNLHVEPTSSAMSVDVPQTIDEAGNEQRSNAPKFVPFGKGGGGGLPGGGTSGAQPEIAKSSFFSSKGSSKNKASSSASALS